jgi:hypothetical protein
MARIKQALLQHGPCEAASASLLSATAELPFCQDGSLPFRARHRRRTCSCESNSKHQAAHRVREVRQVVGNGGSVRVLFAVAVAWLCAPMSAGSSAQYQTPATPRVVIREPGTFAGSGGVLCLRGRACETRPCRPLPRAAKLRSAAPDTALPCLEEGPSAPTAKGGCEQDGRSYCLPSHAHLRTRLRGGGQVFQVGGFVEEVRGCVTSSGLPGSIYISAVTSLNNFLDPVGDCGSAKYLLLSPKSLYSRGWSRSRIQPKNLYSRASGK